MEIALQKPRGKADWLRLWLLYLEAFPASERKPFASIRNMYRQGRADVWCIRENGQFLGLATTVNGDDLILLDYFAVKKKFRGQGIGSRAMGCLLEQYSGKGVFLEIESTREDCSDRENREKRKQFYLACGLEDLHTEAKVFSVRMELLGVRCRLDFEGYRNFYRNHYSCAVAEHLERV